MTNLRARLTNLERTTVQDEPVIEPLTDTDRQRRIELLFRQAEREPENVDLQRRAQAVKQIMAVSS